MADTNNSKLLIRAGWALSALPVLLLSSSAFMKLTKAEPILESIAEFGHPESHIIPIGITEVICTVLYVVPQTAALGAILLTGYLGGATVTHVRVGDPFVAPIVVGVLLWGGLFLRDSRVRALIPIRRLSQSNEDS